MRNVLLILAIVIGGLFSQSQASTIVVPAGGDLQAAINSAQCRDTIEVEAGATFVTPMAAYTIPAKNIGCVDGPEDVITVRSSRYASLPVGRVGSADAANMFKIVSNNPGAALRPGRNSKWWKFIGMEVTDDGSVFTGRLIDTATPQGGTDEPSTWGTEFTFDHCYIHPSEDGTTDYTDRHTFVGVGWNAGKITITKSRISGFGGLFQGSVSSSGCFWSNYGGPYLLDDNYLSSTFNPIFLGAGENGSPNQATIGAGATMTQATLSHVNNLQVGDKIALEVHLPSSGGYDFWLYGVTVNAATDTLSYNGHGFNNDDACYVGDYLDSAASVGLTSRDNWRVYYVVNKTASTFQLSQTRGGSVVNLTGDSTKGGIRVGANGHRYANAVITGISGNIVTYSTGLVRWEGDQRPDAIYPFQYVASSELPLAGGVARWRGYQAHDFTFTRNTLELDYDMQLWMHQQNGSNAKGYMEIKNLVTGLMEGNVFTGYPSSLLLTNSSQNSTSPWVTIKDVTIRSNVFQSFATMVIVQLISGQMSDEGSNIRIVNNLAYNLHDVNVLLRQTPSVLYTSGGTLTPLVFQHNTVINKPANNGYAVTLCIVPMPNPRGDTGAGFQFIDNLLWYGNAGFLPCTNQAFAQSFPHMFETNNGWIDSAEFPKGSVYITGTSGFFPNSLYLANDSLVLFTNAALRDYSLHPASPWHNAASDGTDIGVNWPALQSALTGAPSIPIPSPSASPSPTPTPLPSPSPTPSPTPTPRCVKWNPKGKCLKWN